MTTTPTSSTSSRLFDNLTTAVIALDEDLKVTALNTAAEQLLGISANKALGRRLTQVASIPDSLFARLRKAIDMGQPINNRQVQLHRPYH